MGKFKSKKVRNDPLLVQLAEDKSVRHVPRKKDVVRGGTKTEENTDEVTRLILFETILLSYHSYSMFHYYAMV